MFCWDGWCIDHQTLLLVFTGLRNLVDIFLIVNEHPLLFQLTCQIRRSLVVASYDKTFLQEVSGNGTHSNTARTYKIDRFDIVYIHFAKLITSLAIISAESGSANFSTFSLSDFSLLSLLTVLTASSNKVAGASASLT